MMRKNIYELFKKDGKSHYQAWYDTHYLNQEQDLLSDHVGVHMNDKKVSADVPSEMVGRKHDLKSEQE